jgi:hypothetical protein
MFLKTTLVVVITTIITTGIHAQNTFPSTGAAGIGTTSPNTSSLLEIKSKNKGILIPRMTLAQRNAISTPATGLLIYQTNATPGFYYHNGTAWTMITSGSATETDPQVGVIDSNKVPRWDGVALVTGSITDINGHISVGNNASSQYRINASASALGEGGIQPAGKSAIRGESNYFSGNTDNAYATGFLGVTNPSSIYPKVSGINGFPDLTIARIAALGVKEPDTLQGAGLYGWNRGGATTNYGVKGIVTSSSGTNYGVYGTAYAEISAGSGSNYGLYGKAATFTGQTGYGVYATSGGTGTNFAGYFEGHVKLVDDNEALTVSGTDPYIQLDQSGTNIGYLRAKGNNLLMSVNLANSSGNIQFLTKNKTRMWIDSTGSVSISDDGKIKPGYLLNVKGKVVAEEILVQLSSQWPDYVFNKNYKLMQLPELKKYISQNNHLPEVPSADQMKDGIAVGDMNKLLMQKVEELTLYVLQLNEEIQALKARNK